MPEMLRQAQEEGQEGQGRQVGLLVWPMQTEVQFELRNRPVRKNSVGGKRWLSSHKGIWKP